MSAPTAADRSAAGLRERGWGHGQQCSAADLAMTAPDGAALARGAQRSRRGGGVERSDASAVTDAAGFRTALPCAAACPHMDVRAGLRSRDSAAEGCASRPRLATSSASACNAQGCASVASAGCAKATSAALSRAGLSPRRVSSPGARGTRAGFRSLRCGPDTPRCRAFSPPPIPACPARVRAIFAQWGVDAED